jgi:hypothetical protein
MSESPMMLTVSKAGKGRGVKNHLMQRRRWATVNENDQEGEKDEEEGKANPVNHTVTGTG